MSTHRSFVAFVIVLGITTSSDARLIPEWPYTKLMEESDVVVVGVPLQSDYTGQKTDEIIGSGATLHKVHTKFQVRLTLKGKPNRELVVRHFELVLRPLEVVEDPPNTIEFVKRKRKGEAGIVLAESKKDEYLLFLKTDTDGSFAFVTGVMDPQLAVRSLSLLPNQ